MEQWLEQAGEMKGSQLKTAIKTSGHGTMLVGVEELNGQLQLRSRASHS